MFKIRLYCKSTFLQIVPIKYSIRNCTYNFKNVVFSVPNIDPNIPKEKELRAKYSEDIEKVKFLNLKLQQEVDCDEKEKIIEDLLHIANKVPNTPHSDIAKYEEQPKLIKQVRRLNFGQHKPIPFSEIVNFLRLCRHQNLSNYTGHKSYYFINDLARLEHALIRYTLTRLRHYRFQLISVPDIIPSQIVERCGMNTRGDRTQVYFLDKNYGSNQCLSGTSEMAIGGYLQNTEFKEEQLPLLYTAVSRCYRAETSGVSEEKGIYRVHQFTKVEMFGVTSVEQSDEQLSKFLDIQETHFNDLGLDYQILDMPFHELGAPASRKYDIEAWMPGRQMFGEVSSCSNCTDYQSRRLNIKYRDRNGILKYAHTINGTACAVPRLILALVESHQQADGTITIPEVLRPFMNGQDKIKKDQRTPNLRPPRSKKKSK